MKVKFLVKLLSLILGESISGEEPRADMYLPIWLLAFALVLVLGGIGLGVYAVMALSIPAGIGALACLGLGISAFLCWKNQKINMISNEFFEYTTFLGNKKTYRFYDIKGVKQNSDSTTLLVADGKVHIETCAIFTERLANRINEQLDSIYQEDV